MGEEGVGQLAPQSRIDQGRTADKMPNCLPDRGRNHPLVEAIQRSIFQGEGISTIPGQGFITAFPG